MNKSFYTKNNLNFINTHIRGIRDEFPEKDLLVRIESIDNERHKLSDLSLEGEGLHLAIIHLNVFRHLHTQI